MFLFWKIPELATSEDVRTKRPHAVVWVPLRILRACVLQTWKISQRYGKS